MQSGRRLLLGFVEVGLVSLHGAQDEVGILSIGLERIVKVG